MRRLLLVSLRAIVAFPRNPSWRLVLEKVATLQTPQNAEGFRVFHAFLPPNTGGYAWFRASRRFLESQRIIDAVQINRVLPAAPHHRFLDVWPVDPTPLRH